jgi:hypothetical protein
VGKGREALLNRPIFEGLPEVKEQGFEELLANVFETGKTWTAYATPLEVPRNGNITHFARRGASV